MGVGHEWVGLIRQILDTHGIGKITLQGHDSGIIEVAATNHVADYVIDIPTVLPDTGYQNDKHFTRLA